jgi:hypothetical protein
LATIFISRCSGPANLSNRRRYPGGAEPPLIFLLTPHGGLPHTEHMPNLTQHEIDCIASYAAGPFSVMTDETGFPDTRFTVGLNSNGVIVSMINLETGTDYMQ